ncbi:response regulator [Dongshaea marina]|uniref:response regulator n=1 Tax=Dongshaea marina TaxID=2047966 RepID=UPI000D3EC2E1|nr:response regulator [Dongshaea marina]
MEQKVLTTGEVAQYCQVNLRTVIRWIDKGYLRAYKLPGRGNNRIPLDAFIEFIQQHNMPLPQELQPLLRPRVLIVDDEPEVTHAIGRLLHRHKFECREVNDGFSAGVALGEFKPQLVTLDLGMPDMDGFAVLKQIRSVSEHIRILVISALAEEKLQQALEHGADAIIAKPFESDELLEQITQLLGEGMKET